MESDSTLWEAGLESSANLDSEGIDTRCIKGENGVAGNTILYAQGLRWPPATFLSTSTA